MQAARGLFVAGERRRRCVDLALAGVVHLPQHRRHRHDQQGRDGITSRSQHQPASRGGRAARDQQRLAEDHLLEKPLDEVAAPLHGLQGPRPGQVHAERARQRAGEPVDRRALLGARGEIDAPHHRRRIVSAATERCLQELRQHRLEAGDLAGEHRYPRSPVRIAFGLQAVEQPRIQPLHEAPQLGGEACRRTVRVARQIERRAPHLRAPVAVEIVEELGKPRDQVRLGEHDIDGYPHAETGLQLPDPGADRRGVCPAFGPWRLGEVAERECHEKAVQRLPRPGLLKQVEECVPARAIDCRVGVLRGVAPGGVDQHGIFGEPPIA